MAVTLHGFALYQHVPLMALHPQLFDIKGTACSSLFINLEYSLPTQSQEGQHLSLSLVTLSRTLSSGQGC